MINQAKIAIPYPKQIGFISFNTKRTISFSFDNLSLFLFQQRHNLKSSEDFEKWKKDKGSFDYLIHAAFSAAESYCIHNRLKFDLDIKKFALGFAQANEKELESLIKRSILKLLCILSLIIASAYVMLSSGFTL